MIELDSDWLRWERCVCSGRCSGGVAGCSGLLTQGAQTVATALCWTAFQCWKCIGSKAEEAAHLPGLRVSVTRAHVRRHTRMRAHTLSFLSLRLSELHLSVLNSFSGSSPQGGHQQRCFVLTSILLGFSEKKKKNPWSNFDWTNLGHKPILS